MTVLSSLEKHHRDTIHSRIASGRPPFLKAFAAAFFAMPFAMACFLMIPFVGQLLPIGNLLLTVLYCFRRRSWLLFFSFMAGGVASMIITSIIGSILMSKVAIAAYLLMAFSSAGMIAYLIGITGALWHAYQEAEEGVLSPSQERSA